jgi:hypothetical protein
MRQVAEDFEYEATCAGRGTSRRSDSAMADDKDGIGGPTRVGGGARLHRVLGNRTRPVMARYGRRQTCLWPCRVRIWKNEHALRRLSAGRFARSHSGRTPCGFRRVPR